MKHTLKGWLADNVVTADNKDDKILLLEPADSMNFEDILLGMFDTNAIHTLCTIGDNRIISNNKSINV